MPHFPSFEHWFPPNPPLKRRPAPPFTLRHPTEDDLAAVEGRLRDWSEQHGCIGPGRAGRHLAATSWLAVADPADAHPAEPAVPQPVQPRRAGRWGSPGRCLATRSGEASIQRIAMDPVFRHRGIGRALVGRFSDAQERAGEYRLTAA